MRDRAASAWLLAKDLAHSEAPRVLRLATVGSTVAVLGAGWLALPGDPSHPWAGVQTAAQKPAVLVPLCALVLVGLLWSARGWAFERRLREPGPIKLIGIEDATGAMAAPLAVAAPSAPVSASADGAAADTTTIALVSPSSPTPAGAAGPAPVPRLAMHLRQRLSELRLTAPTTIPGAKASNNFVELLGTTKLDVKQPFAAVGQLLHLVSPTHAYEVKAAALLRDEAPRYGVATETSVLPRRLTVFTTHWDESWEHALDRAASAVGALVVPFTRQRDQGPWSLWASEPLDEQLFDDYQEVQRLRAQHRYDEAIARCYSALRRDPFNDYLRFQLGILQEELALHLDALLTYHAIILAVPERRRAARTRAQRRAQSRIELMTRYRFTVLLGFGERLGPQWVTPPSSSGRSRRTDELKDLRARLRPILCKHFGSFRGARPEDLALLGVDPAEPAKLDALLADEPEPEPARSGGSRPSRRARERERDLRQRRVTLLFQVFALREVERLLRDWTRRDIESLDVGLTPTALELLPSWAQLRARHARHALETAIDPEKVRTSWPPTYEDVSALWQERSPGKGKTLQQRLNVSEVFIDHYNAACALSVGLLRDRDQAGAQAPTPQRVELEEAAVGELRRATAVSTSKEISGQWDWIVTEDPDLAGLRAAVAFRSFEGQRFPSPRRAPVRPTNIVDLEAARYSACLFRECTRRLEKAWHGAAEAPGPTDIHVALAWWADEERAWLLARELAFHHRHWQTRHRVIQEMQRFVSRHGGPAFAVAHPRYATNPLEVPFDEVDHVARRECVWANRRMGALRTALSEVTAGSVPGFAAWSAYLHALDRDGLDLAEETRRLLAVNRAWAWGTLHAQYRREITSEEDVEDVRVRFKDAVDHLEVLTVPATTASRSSRAAAAADSSPGRRAAPRATSRRRQGESGPSVVVHPPRWSRGQASAREPDEERWARLVTGTRGPEPPPPGVPSIF